MLNKLVLNNMKVIALLLSISLLSGCNEATNRDAQETTIQGNVQLANATSVPTSKTKKPIPATGNAVRVARWSLAPNGPSMAALSRGKLAIVNNCLVMSSQDAPPMLLIFPYRSGVWDSAKQTFTYHGKVMRIGEPIAVGGGRIQNLDALKGTGKYYVPDCGITDLWLAS